MNSVFSEQILADKLSKLNSTQQCIENSQEIKYFEVVYQNRGRPPPNNCMAGVFPLYNTLSHWCIFHRTKAELVVATWSKQFHASQQPQKVPFLYLANDILQNSKRKGNEFVTEFWKVLPLALKDVSENGDEHGKTAVSRLVDIWEERRVFGSRPQSLKDLMLGKESLPPLEFNRKRSRSVRIIKRDSRSIRTKLAIGGTTEKIVSAFHSVLTEHPSEDLLMNKCKSAVHRVRKMEKDVDAACKKEGDPKRTSLASELEEEEAVLKECIEKLKTVEATRETLVSELKEALHEQESELENVRTQLQVAEAQAEETCNMRRRLNNEPDVPPPKPSSASATPPLDSNSKAGETAKNKAASIAALVADKLAASTSSQQIMTSVLSSFAKEEAKNAGLATTTTSSTSFTSAPANSYTEMRPQLEKPMAVMDSNVYIAAQPPSVPTTYQTVLVHQPSMQQGQTSTSQPQYHLLTNQPSQQYMQQPGGIMSGGVPYVYSNMAPPPPPGPPPPPHMMSMAPQYTQQQQTQLIQQPPAPPSFRPLQPPGMLYYTHHQPQ